MGIKFIMTQEDPDWVEPAPEPFVNKPEWGADSGDVIFMDDDHFSEYKDETEQFLAFFYAPWCGHCKATKPHYGKASTKVSTPMLAFDCTGSAREICDKEEVKSYPTIKYFTDDDYEDYTGGRDEADFIKFLSENTEDTDLVDDDEVEEEEEETEDKPSADAKTAEPEEKTKEKGEGAETEDQEGEVYMKKDEL